MVTCADVEFEIDEVSKTVSNNSSHHNVLHSENNQNYMPKKSFFRLDPKWGQVTQSAFTCSMFKVNSSSHSSKYIVRVPQGE